MLQPSRALLPALALLALVAAPAAAAFEGRLLLADGSPAAGYVVSVVGQGTTVAADAEGHFRIEPAPRPPFWVVATGPDGAVSAPQRVDEAAAGPVDVVLPPLVRETVTVVSGVAPSLDKSPANAATVVTGEEIEQRAPQRLYQALESVAGASKLGEGADSVPALRGLARGRTLVLLDGARVSAERRAGPAATFVSPESLGAVEVLRGPGSVVYGSDAFGGVINAVTRDPEEGRRGGRFHLDLATGALDQWGAYAAGFAPTAGGALLVDAHWRSAADGEAGEGVPIFNSGLDARGLGLRFVRAVGAGRLRLGLGFDRVDDLGKAAADSRQVRATYPEESSDRFVASWLGTPGGGWESLEGLLAYDEYRVVLDRDRAPTATASRRVDRADTAARDATLRWVGVRPLAGGRLRLGADASSRFDLHATTARVDYAADGATVVRTTGAVAIDDARQVATGLFATWSRALGRNLSLEAGLRGDDVATRNRGGFFGDREQDHSALSGNLALTWAGPAGWSTSAQVARGFRSPTLSDRYFRGPSGRGFVTGNPDLDPETSLQLDLATRWTRRSTVVAVYAYRYEIDDLVERYGEGADFYFRNRGSATMRGVEVEAQMALGKRWGGDLGAAWADGETDGGATVDDLAPPNGWATLRWTVARGYALARVTAFAAHADPGPTEVERPGFALLDLGAGWRINDELELRALVRNATDKLYTGSPDESADRSPGRSLTLALSGRY